jgi:hypothetical protein
MFIRNTVPDEPAIRPKMEFTVMKKIVWDLVMVAIIISAIVCAGCADIKATQKVGDFGTAFGVSSEEQKAIDWFKTTYGDPLANNDQPARFVEPLITTALDTNNLPTSKVTTFPVDGGSVYFFVIYDNFKQGDPITVSWTYLENGKEVTSVQQQAGGDFGRFIVEFQKPDSGWGKGKQRITVTGDSATGTVDFEIGDTLQTTALPYSPTGGTTTGTTTTTGSLTCPSGQVICAGKCMDLNNDITNCGACGRACAKGQTCNKAVCTIGTTTVTTTTLAKIHSELTVTPAAKKTCDSGDTLCGPDCVDLDTNPYNCGQCGVNCTDIANGRSKCSYGTCILVACPLRYGDCNQVAKDGCEIDLYVDVKNCGECGHACSVGQYCEKGICRNQ